jgi:beta-lactamase class A
MSHVALAPSDRVPRRFALRLAGALALVAGLAPRGALAQADLPEGDADDPPSAIRSEPLSKSPRVLPSASADELARAWKARFEATVKRLNQRFKGRIALFVSDPKLGVRVGVDHERPSYLASGVKVPFMVEVFRQVHQGTLSLDEELVYDADAIRDGAPRMNQKPLGSKVKVRELLTLMIKDSDNAASDMIARRVGLENINRGLEEEGFVGFTPLTYLIDVRRATLRAVDLRADDLSPQEIRDVRWVVGWDSQAKKLAELCGRPAGTYKGKDLIAGFDRFYETDVNSARLDAVAMLLERIVKKELVSADASRQMLDLMTNTHTSRNRILGKLPAGLTVAHKTGSQYERICDLGIIFLSPDEPLVFTACLAGGNDRNLAEATLADLARDAVDAAMPAHPKKR